jgi:hypothetical protein
VLLETGLAIAKLPAHRYPKRARISSSQPPLLECCDDRLNPPSIRGSLVLLETLWNTGSPAFAGDDERVCFSVIAGLDPAIHLLRKNLLEDGWMRGSSPRMTLRECFPG